MELKITNYQSRGSVVRRSIEMNLRVQGVHRDIHASEEIPQVLSVDICDWVPLDQASDAVDAFENWIYLFDSVTNLRNNFFLEQRDRKMYT